MTVKTCVNINLKLKRSTYSSTKYFLNSSPIKDSINKEESRTAWINIIIIISSVYRITFIKPNQMFIPIADSVTRKRSFMFP